MENQVFNTLRLIFCGDAAGVGTEHELDRCNAPAARRFANRYRGTHRG
jgi:hypothetical protein